MTIASPFYQQLLQHFALRPLLRQQSTKYSPSVANPCNSFVVLMSAILDNPTELASYRRRLFELQDEVLLTRDDWDALWPYIDNLWVERNAARNKDRQQFNCRIWRNDSEKKAGEGKRNRVRRNVDPCGMKMYVVKKPDGGVVVSRFGGRNGDVREHNHDLEYIDKIKTPSAIMKIAAEQIANGKTPSEAVSELKNKNIVKVLEESGGLHLDNNRVRNAYKTYKQLAANGGVRNYAPRSTPNGTPRVKPPGMKVICQCGDVSFETPTPAPMDVYHCHCLECRKQSASAFGTSAIFPAKDLFPLSVELVEKLSCYTRPTKSGGTMDCYFCSNCGVRMFHRTRNPDGTGRPTVSIKGGCIEELDWSHGKHIYTRSAVVPIPPGAEQWRASPEVMEARSANFNPTASKEYENQLRPELPEFPELPFK